MLAASLVCALAARTARADVGDTIDDDNVDIPAWEALPVPSGVGVGLTIGGGITGFAGHTLRSATAALGGAWEARATFGTREAIALEASYLGSATTIGAEVGHGQATLLGTTLEADLRVNLMPAMLVDPYVFAGLGWQRYQLENPDFAPAMAGIEPSDDMWDVPVGAGIDYRAGGFIASVRGTFRAVRDANLVVTPIMGRLPSVPRFAPMHSWEASLSVGFEM